MRKLFFILFFVPVFLNAQAHLGSTEQEIRGFHTDKYFKTDYTTDGIKYISTDFDFGTFYYYFNSQTSLTDLCIQIPKNSGAINAQAEIYNKKYTINSTTSWTAYLDDGGIISIKLQYNTQYKISVFIYKSGE
jgi:beta-glucosidase/6-phospho-beta-glucosidase/beta-galactosidase